MEPKSWEGFEQIICFRTKQNGLDVRAPNVPGLIRQEAFHDNTLSYTTQCHQRYMTLKVNSPSAVIVYISTNLYVSCLSGIM